MIGSIVMIRGGEVGIVTGISEGWLVIDNDLSRVTLPGDAIVIDPTQDDSTLIWLARQMHIEPLKAHLVPPLVRKLAGANKMAEVQQSVEELKSELATTRQQFDAARQQFETEKTDLERRVAELLLAQGKHDKILAERETKIFNLKQALADARREADKREFDELSVAKQTIAVRDAKIELLVAQLEAIKAEAARPKKLAWEVKTLVDAPDYSGTPGDAAIAAALNDGWEIVAVNFSRGLDYGGRIVTLKRLSEIPAAPAPDPDAAVAAAEAHIATLEEPAPVPAPLEAPEPEVVYHISGKRPALGPVGEHIRQHGLADAIDVMNYKIGKAVTEAMSTAVSPAATRFLNSPSQFRIATSNPQ